MTVVAATPIKPLLRGYLHLALALLMPAALVYLLLVASSPAAYVGAAVFGAGLLLLFSISAAYHIAPWPAVARRVVARFDHSTIFVAIAACYTPFCLQTLSLAWGIPILSVAWSLALAGVLLKITWIGAPRWLGLACYLAAGWLALIPAAPLSGSLSGAAMLGLLGAGILFSLGGIAYAARWPDLAPRYFGHHEVFHALVGAGAVVLYCVVALEVLPG
jgi:hemolysin III